MLSCVQTTELGTCCTTLNRLQIPKTLLQQTNRYVTWYRFVRAQQCCVTKSSGACKCNITLTFSADNAFSFSLTGEVLGLNRYTLLSLIGRSTSTGQPKKVGFLKNLKNNTNENLFIGVFKYKHLWLIAETQFSHCLS